MTSKSKETGTPDSRAILHSTMMIRNPLLNWSRPSREFIRAICGLVVLGWSSIAIAEETVPPGSPEQGLALQKIVLLGASVTAGFDKSQPFGGPKALQFRLANYVDAALPAKREASYTEANSLLFLSPVETMEKEVTATIAHQPDLVIGLDSLFWFCYGANLTAEERLARFEVGLKQLERIHAPIVLGDLPDASAAAGGILSRDEIPDPATIAACNERLKTWAAGRPNVAIIPLAKAMESAMANEQTTIDGVTWEKGKSGALLREDHLHPSPNGLAILAVAALDRAAGFSDSKIPAGAIRHDIEAISSEGMAKK